MYVFMYLALCNSAPIGHHNNFWEKNECDFTRFINSNYRIIIITKHNFYINVVVCLNFGTLYIW